MPHLLPTKSGLVKLELFWSKNLQSFVSPSSLSGSPGDQRVPNVKQIITKGGCCLDTPGKIEKIYCSIHTWDLRAFPPKPTSISPSGSSSACIFTHLHLLQFNQLLCLQHILKEKKTLVAYYGHNFFSLHDRELFCNLEMVHNPAKVCQGQMTTW